jgi:hypothetical protein
MTPLVRLYVKTSFVFLLLGLLPAPTSRCRSTSWVERSRGHS